jgi:hypothetical protein
MDLAATLLRWIHIVSAAVLVGSLFHMRFVSGPAAGALDEEGVRRFRVEASRRARRLLHTAIGLILLSGVANYLLALRGDLPPAYHMLLGMKIVLALVVIALAIMVTLPPEKGLPPPRRRTVLGVAILGGLLVILLACMAGALR